MRIKTSQLALGVLLPSVDTPVKPYKLPEVDPDQFKPKEVRQKAPFQAGDVVWVETFNGTVKAVVLRVFSDFNERQGYWIPKYRVAAETKKGKWSEEWFYTFPGYVFRG